MPTLHYLYIALNISHRTGDEPCYIQSQDFWNLSCTNELD